MTSRKAVNNPSSSKALVSHPMRQGVCCLTSPTMVQETDFYKTVNLILADQQYFTSVTRLMNPIGQPSFFAAGSSFSEDNNSQCSLIGAVVAGVQYFANGVFESDDAARFYLPKAWANLYKIYFGGTGSKKIRASFKSIKGPSFDFVHAVRGYEVMEELIALLIQTTKDIYKYNQTQQQSATNLTMRMAFIKHGFSLWKEAKLAREKHLVLAKPMLLNSSEEDYSNTVQHHILKVLAATHNITDEAVTEFLDFLVHTMDFLWTMQMTESKSNPSLRGLIYLIPYLASNCFMDVSIYTLAMGPDLCHQLKPFLVVSPVSLGYTETVDYLNHARMDRRLVLIYNNQLEEYLVILPILEHALVNPYRQNDGTMTMTKFVPGYSHYVPLNHPSTDCTIEKKINWIPQKELYNDCSLKPLERLLAQYEGDETASIKEMTSLYQAQRKNPLTRTILDTPNQLSENQFYLTNMADGTYGYVGQFKLKSTVDLSTYIPGLGKSCFIFQYSLDALTKALKGMSQMDVDQMIGHIGTQALSHSSLEKTKLSFPHSMHRADSIKDLNPIYDTDYHRMYYTKLLLAKKSQAPLPDVLSIQYPNALEDIHFPIRQLGLSDQKPEGHISELLLVYFIRSAQGDGDDSQRLALLLNLPIINN